MTLPVILDRYETLFIFVWAVWRFPAATSATSTTTATSTADTIRTYKYDCAVQPRTMLFFLICLYYTIYKATMFDRYGEHGESAHMDLVDDGRNTAHFAFFSPTGTDLNREPHVDRCACRARDTTLEVENVGSNTIPV